MLFRSEIGDKGRTKGKELTNAKDRVKNVESRCFLLIYALAFVKTVPTAEVIEDAKQNFASPSTAKDKDLPLPPLSLPLACNVSQDRSSRLPRRVLAASQIFQADENGNVSPMDETMLSTGNSTFLSANDISRSTILPPADTLADPKTPSSPSQKKTSQLRIPEIHTPSRQRRATVSTRSPEPSDQVSGIEGSPSKPKERSRSYGNLFQRRIAPISLLEAELNKSLLFLFALFIIPYTEMVGIFFSSPT